MEIAVFLAACLGHTAIVIRLHNWWYGFPFPWRWPSKIVHLVHAALVVAFPVVLFLYFKNDARSVFDFSSPSTSVLSGYLLVCCLVSLLIFPLITLRRVMRPMPMLRSNDTVTRDFAREIGHCPVSTIRHLGLARLPFNEIFQVDFAEKTLTLHDLPAEWDGLSILHLSDLHYIGVPGRVFHQRVLDACTAWEPDIIALTGDIVDTHEHRRWIVPLLGRLRWKIAAFAILGNHDRYYEPKLIRRRLARVGMKVLGNGWQQLEVRGRPMIVIGHEGPWFRPDPDLSACPQGPFRLCLSHTPDNIGWARRHGIQLMLSGHVHGGQIRLPLFGSVLVPSRYSRRYDCGIFHEPPTLLHVSRGLGQEHAIRINCRPEVVKLVLRKA
jgi:predicted MPP superfamily phosphohydrolase